MVTRLKAGITKPQQRLCLMAMGLTDTSPSEDHAPSLVEPTCFFEAIHHPHWRRAMSQALQNQGTWTLIPPPQNHTIIPCKWIYKIKRDVASHISRYKAQLMAKGCTQ